MTSTDQFPRGILGLAAVARPDVVRLRDGDHYELRIAPVVKQIGKDAVRMIAYNGSIPGPTLHVDQGSEITAEVTNDGDVETTVHWHGLRLDNRYDGVPGGTQAPIGIGKTFTYKVKFPDPGFYWYHPHLREDYGQELGMYGTIIVEPADPAYWPAVDRQMAITLDDVLIEDGRIAAFSRSGPTFTAMGRFGNVLLINGEEQLQAEATLDEVVRLHLVNTANTRIFNVAVSDARMKLVGGDSGRYERETIVAEILLAPSERAIVDVRFDRAGDARIEHRTPDHTYDLGSFQVIASVAAFDELRLDPGLTALRATLGHDREREPDKVLAFVAKMPLLYGPDYQTSSTYTCPMHPEVTSSEPSHCPRCGMKLMPAPASAATHEHGEADHAPAPLDAVPALGPTLYACPMHPEVTGSGATKCPLCGMWLTLTAPAGEATSTALVATEHGHGTELAGDGLEWEDLMPEINRQSNPTNMLWCVVDRATGAQNHEIFWNLTVGDRVKVRLVNEMESDHPMHHPFHIHGAGRFLILSRDGEPDPNLVWKDTVLVPAGKTVDILLEVTNPGRWMAHCHIAEHAESGMMFSFDVAEAPHTREIL
jgi:FtsP/CotA-like multicopper oxidase with cupredoxin domain